jgi:type IV pilus assembly protein PilE
VAADPLMNAGKIIGANVNMKQTQRGVTLVELMIAVGIVGILAAIAYPSYQNQVMRTTRTEGRVALEQRAQALEKCFTRYMAYNNTTLCAAAQTAAVNTSDGHYSITLVPGTPPDTKFELRAAARGTQARDTACATMTLNDEGRRAPPECW